MLFLKRQRIKMLVISLGLMILLLGCTQESATPSPEGVDTHTSQPEAKPTEMVVEPEPSQTLTNTSQPATATFLPADTQTPFPTETPVPSQTPRVLPTLVVDEFGVSMALIPAGSFQMGFPKGQDDEKPIHAVKLDDFYLDQYEVTNARYAACVEVGICDAPADTSSKTRENYYGSSEYADYPVINIDWHQAQTYCQWRGGRLPTEAEWEKAARGGLAGKMYPWGDEISCSYANHGVNIGVEPCVGDTHLVGGYAANGYDLYDMAGNVWEWVADWYDVTYYANSSPHNPQGPGYGDTKVLRGGSWVDPQDWMGVGSRFGRPPSTTDESVGFRCAHDIFSEDVSHEETPPPPETTQALAVTPDAETTPVVLPTNLTDASGVPMALIPTGSFRMGSLNEAGFEWPIHTVTLDDFYIDQYEVTNAHYAACVDAGVCTPPTDTSSYTRESYYGNLEYANYPVIYISWEAAQTYCQWREARLPTEAEWEKAARGGLEDQFYPWGNDIPVCEIGATNGAKFDDDAACDDTDTEQVGSYSANGYGLYDMAGNVWEWVADWYSEDYYINSPDHNPTGPETGANRVLRGGSWDYSFAEMQTPTRIKAAPSYAYNSIGFRCARGTESP